MDDRMTELMTAYELRLGRDLRATSDVAVRAFDPSAITRSVALGAATGGRWFRPFPAVSARAMVALLLAFALVGGALLIGSRLRDQAPIFRLGHLAYGLDGDIWIADRDGTDAVKVTDGLADGRSYQSPQWSSDGSVLSFETYDSALDTTLFFQTDGEGLGLQEVGRGMSGTYAPVSPSGARRVMYDLSVDLMIIDRDGPSIAIPPPPGFLRWGYWETPAWTPDSSRVIASACSTSGCKSDSTHELFSVPLSGAAPTRLTPPGVHDHAPSVSPDGSLVAFSTQSGPDFHLGLVGIDGSGRRVFPLAARDIPSIIWAPDGQSLAIGHRLPGGGIWIVSMDPDVPPRLLAGTDRVGHLLGFSPDGRWILLTPWPDAATDLWRVEVDGEIRERLVSGPFQGGWQTIRDGS